jgi:hypothetical protein
MARHLQTNRARMVLSSSPTRRMGSILNSMPSISPTDCSPLPLTLASSVRGRGSTTFRSDKGRFGGVGALLTLAREAIVVEIARFACGTETQRKGRISCRIAAIVSVL